MKYQGVHLIKYVLWDLYVENYKMLMKESKEDLDKWGGTVSIDWKTQHSKISILPKLKYRSYAIPFKLPARFFGRYIKDYFKSIWEGQGSRIAKKFLKKEKYSGRITLPDFKTYYIL